LTILHVTNSADERVILIPQWLVLAGISPQAVMLYCLYQVSITRRRISPSVSGIPQSLDEYAVALHLDHVTQVQAAHQELLAVDAAEETVESDEDGNVTTVVVIHELSPSQRAEAEQQRQQLAERQATTLQDPLVNTAPPGNVYLIRETLSRLVKIGYSDNVTKRHKGLQTSNPNQLELLGHMPGDRDLEDALHERFKKRRVRGEWFDFGTLDPVKEVSRAIQQIQKRYPKTG
jgi:hypothetical protein